MFLSTRFQNALVYATQLHANQIRKGTSIPYVSHLLAVASIVLDHGGDEDEVIAALLHDAIEDQGGATTREKIRQSFGDHVVEIINGCTDSETIPKPPWRERKIKYIDHLHQASASICLVSAADKLHNARGILNDYRQLGDEVWQRFNGGKEGSLWFYRSVADILEVSYSSPLVDELKRVVEELESLVIAESSLYGSG